MASRWAVLAVEARRLGCLDYGKVTCLNEDSLALEALIFRSLDIEHSADALKILMSMVQDGSARFSLYQKYLKCKSPWLADTPEKSKPEMLKELYNRLVKPNKDVEDGSGSK